MNCPDCNCKLRSGRLKHINMEFEYIFYKCKGCGCSFKKIETNFKSHDCIDFGDGLTVFNEHLSLDIY